MARSKRELKPAWTPGDLATVSDNPEWTAEDLARAKPARAVLAPELLEGLKRQRGQRGLQKSPTKQLVSLRLDRDVIEAFKDGGPGWQSRINEVLRKALGR